MTTKPIRSASVGRARNNISKGGHPFSYADFLRWLGMEAHRKKQFRTVSPVLNSTTVPLRRFLNHTFPWSVRDYPGKHAMLAHILGIGVGAAERYLSAGKVKTPPRHIRRCIAWLEARRSADQAMISTLQTYLPRGPK
ncbi:MAG TPA: hypothetical protein VM711_10985 [Sphingomicrobium sp.]|nr:hypothetical protein [Sphingomicrobium sp.]